MSFIINETQSIICKLIAAAMFHTKENFTADADWNAVKTEMHFQTLHGIVMDILPALPISEDLRKSWTSECLQVMSFGIRQRFEQEIFLGILDKADIPYVVLKGTAAAMYYPNPAFRSMGDVDVFIPESFHEKVRELLINNQYTLKETETNYKRHLEFFKNNTEFEVHKKFATINGSKEKDYIDGLLEECCNDPQKRVRIVQGQTVFFAPQTYVNGIVLLEHIGQHMISGLGLRQIIDWMMFVNEELHDNEWESFQIMVENAGLVTLAKVVTKTCIDYFGLTGSFEWCMDADKEVSEEILEYLFESGNFGRKQSYAMKVPAVESIYKNSKNIFATLQSIGEFNWKLYKKHTWLRPFAWLYQIFRYVRQIFVSKDGFRSLSKGSFEASRRLKLMRRLQIYKG